MSEAQKTRIGAHREHVLKPDERKLLDDVEKYGCHIIHVREEGGLPGWSYTVGLYEIFRQPEIIIVGLKDDTAQFVLNEIADRLKTGLQIQEVLRQRELLGKVECEPRRVEERPELRAVVEYATWFYGSDLFPVFQCIYPDLENRFPWEDSFDESWRNRQALLFSTTSITTLERDSWASHDPESSLYDWKFSDLPHTGVYTTKRIMGGDEPILYVYHDQDDGAWQFHGPSESKAESAALVCFHHIVDKDPSIMELIDLPPGWSAVRENVGCAWSRELTPVDSEQE
jgi:hypothetical protein